MRLPCVILQALVLLSARPSVGTSIAYDFQVAPLEPKAATLRVRITERIEAARADGALEATRLYSDVVVRGPRPEFLKGVEAIAGRRDRYTVGRDGLWTPATLNTELGFPDFPLIAGRVPVGATWATNGNLRETRARLKALRTFAGRRAAVLDFLPRPSPAGPAAQAADTIGPGSYWVLDLADGRPLFARIEILASDPARSGVFTLVRRGVPGLVPSLASSLASPLVPSLVPKL